MIYGLFTEQQIIAFSSVAFIFTPRLHCAAFLRDTLYFSNFQPLGISDYHDLLMYWHC